MFYLLSSLFLAILAIYLFITLLYHYYFTTHRLRQSRRRRRSSSDCRLIKDKNVCLLVAHPDDEAMFFGPCIRLLASCNNNNNIHVLCLTSGNFYGLGRVRVDEMRASCINLISPGRLVDVTVVDEPDKLADDPRAQWDRPFVLRTISAYLDHNSIDCLITFDRYRNYFQLIRFLLGIRSKIILVISSYIQIRNKLASESLRAEQFGARASRIGRLQSSFKCVLSRDRQPISKILVPIRFDSHAFAQQSQRSRRRACLCGQLVGFRYRARLHDETQESTSLVQMDLCVHVPIHAYQ